MLLSPVLGSQVHTTTHSCSMLFWGIVLRPPWLPVKHFSCWAIPTGPFYDPFWLRSSSRIPHCIQLSCLPRCLWFVVTSWSSFVFPSPGLFPMVRLGLWHFWKNTGDEGPFTPYCIRRALTPSWHPRWQQPSSISFSVICACYNQMTDSLREEGLI